MLSTNRSFVRSLPLLRGALESFPFGQISGTPRRTLGASAGTQREPSAPVQSRREQGFFEARGKRRIGALQDYSIMAGQAIADIFSQRRYWSEMYMQMDLIGFGSLPIVLLTGLFTGAVLALQSATALREFGALSMTATLVTKSMVKELGPVITGLMVSGRNASGMASELGSMKITDQIDAMRALGTDPVRKLVTPRIYATIIMLVFLTILSDAVGIAGGAFVSVFLLGLDAHSYLHTSIDCLVHGDILQGLVKPIFFGFIISSIGCSFGMRTHGGTQGVGHSTTKAVVFASVFIIVVDFLISRTMISIFGQ
jgi:phospholipid/cholesterol/gamma-HCH transport system permease protein